MPNSMDAPHFANESFEHFHLQYALHHMPHLPPHQFLCARMQVQLCPMIDSTFLALAMSSLALTATPLDRYDAAIAYDALLFAHALRPLQPLRSATSASQLQDIAMNGVTGPIAWAAQPGSAMVQRDVSGTAITVFGRPPKQSASLPVAMVAPDDSALRLTTLPGGATVEWPGGASYPPRVPAAYTSTGKGGEALTPQARNAIIGLAVALVAVLFLVACCIAVILARRRARRRAAQRRAADKLVAQQRSHSQEFGIGYLEGLYDDNKLSSDAAAAAAAARSSSGHKAACDSNNAGAKIGTLDQSAVAGRHMPRGKLDAVMQWLSRISKPYNAGGAGAPVATGDSSASGGARSGHVAKSGGSRLEAWLEGCRGGLRLGSGSRGRRNAAVGHRRRPSPGTLLGVRPPFGRGSHERKHDGGGGSGVAMSRRSITADAAVALKVRNRLLLLRCLQCSANCMRCNTHACVLWCACCTRDVPRHSLQ